MNELLLRSPRWFNTWEIPVEILAEIDYDEVCEMNIEMYFDQASKHALLHELWEDGKTILAVAKDTKTHRLCIYTGDLVMPEEEA